MGYVMTFLEGLASFVSPCMLPLLPVYVAYFAGTSKDRTLVRAVAFVAGFSVVFIALGVFAGTLGTALSAHRTAVEVTCGVVVILFGLSQLGLFTLPLKGVSGVHCLDGVVAAFLFGLVYSVNLTPCVGAFLGAALMQAASAGGAAKGAALLLSYSLGLGIPFVISAVLLGACGAAFGFIKRHYNVITPVCGVLLIAYGAWTAARPFLPCEKSCGQACAEEPVAVAPKAEASKPAAGEEVAVTAANFDAEVLGADKPVLVDFWASWCGPCRRLAPSVAALAKERAAELKVCTVNVDDAQDLAMRYGVNGIPALFVFKRGKIVGQTVGYREKADLDAFVTGALSVEAK